MRLPAQVDFDKFRDEQKAQQIESIDKICVFFFILSSFQHKLMQTGQIYHALCVSFSFSSLILRCHVSHALTLDYWVLSS